MFTMKFRKFLTNFISEIAMKKINDEKLLNALVEVNHLQELFSVPFLPMAELFIFDKGEYLFSQNMPSDYLYFLVSGRVEVFAYIGENRIHCQQYFCSCEIIGETDILWGEPSISYVLALSSCKCIGISLPRYREILLNDIAFLRHVARALSNRLKDKTTDRNRLISLESRLAAYIFDFSNGGIFTANLKETAELLDSSYRHLLRSMSSMCDKGTLKKLGRSCYRIEDMNTLIALKEKKG